MSNKLRSMLMKLIIVGECETGKTLLCKKISDTDLTKGYIPTIGLDMYVLRKQIDDDIEAKIHLWDTSGSPSYFSIIKSYFSACCASIILIDLSSKVVISNTIKWIRELKNVKRNDGQNIIISVFADTSKGIYSKDNTIEVENICRKENVIFYQFDLSKNDEIIKEMFDTFFDIINLRFVLNGSIVHGINYYLDKDNSSLPLLDNKLRNNPIRRNYINNIGQNCCSIL